MAIRLASLVAISLAAGCDGIRDQIATSISHTKPFGSQTRFEPSMVGAVTGTVTWDGVRPNVPALRVCRFTPAGLSWYEVANPNAPNITPAGELVGAVVFLRGIDPAVAAPWPHPLVSVEADETRIAVLPFGRCGFTPVGSEVELRSASDALLGVRARGAGYFTLLLPDRTSARRRLDRPGRVELTSPAYLYWQAADLFVCEHPYFALTDDGGRFRFENVPRGDYEVVCWSPGWEVASSERDPESGAVFRSTYAPAAEVSLPVRVVTGFTSDVRIAVSASTFPSR